LVALPGLVGGLIALCIWANDWMHSEYYRSPEQKSDAASAGMFGCVSLVIGAIALWFFIRAIRKITGKAPASIGANDARTKAGIPDVGKTSAKQQPISVPANEIDNGRDVTFAIPCGVCGYKTNVTVRIDWGGAILSGSSTDHDFRCQNCKKVFTVRKESLTQYTDGFV
jgi:hypothetical protein